MREAKTMRVQELPFEAEITSDAILRVSRDGEVDRRQMHPDLMCAPGLQANVEQRVAGQELHDLEVGHGVTRFVGVEGTLRGIAPITPERRVDPAAS